MSWATNIKKLLLFVSLSLLLWTNIVIELYSRTITLLLMSGTLKLGLIIVFLNFSEMVIDIEVELGAMALEAADTDQSQLIV